MTQTTVHKGPARVYQDEEQALDEWKRCMGQFAAGVTVITALDSMGRAVGTTVSAFSSLSLRPRLLLVCLDRRSRTLEAIRHGGCFAVNMLAAGEGELALNFGRKGEDQFAGIAHARGFLGCPLLERVCARIECRLETIHDGGDHDILIGSPVRVEVMPENAPLVYYAGRFVP